VSASNVRPAPAIGASDFRSLRSAGRLYLDKSRLISLLLRDAGTVLLFPRPRRFGKTLNMTMLQCFFERSSEPAARSTWSLFEGLQVATDGEARAHFARYPTIALSLKDVRSRDYRGMLGSVREEIRRVHAAHRELLGSLPAERGDRFREMLDGRCEDEEILRRALGELSADLAQHWGERCVVLIDEYDAPLQHAYIHGYYDEAVDFFRGFYSAVLKDNDQNLVRGVLTGVLRVVRESLFSGLNNVKVCSILDHVYAESFGFTEDEVASLTGTELPAVRDWYDGYRFGGTRIYNPWSVLSYLDTGRLEPHWANTSDNELIRRLLVDRGLGFSAEIEALLEGGTITQRIDENLALRDIDHSPRALWMFLLFAGYLRVDAARVDDRGATIAELSIPNREVALVYRDLFHAWADEGDRGRGLAGLRRSLSTGDFEELERMIRKVSRETLSFHDGAGHPRESFYHGLVIGLVMELADDYDVRSNRETGNGRADVLLVPRRKDLPGVVLEIKALGPGEPPEPALEGALHQIERQAYATELRSRGIERIHEVAIVFRGKEAWVKGRRGIDGAVLLLVGAVPEIDGSPNVTRLLYDPGLGSRLQRVPPDRAAWSEALDVLRGMPHLHGSVFLRIRARYGIAFSVGRMLALHGAPAVEIEHRDDGEAWTCLYSSREPRLAGKAFLGAPEAVTEPGQEGGGIVVGVDGQEPVNRNALAELAARVGAQAFAVPFLAGGGVVRDVREGVAVVGDVIDRLKQLDAEQNRGALYFVTRLPAALVAAIGFKYPFTALPRIVLLEYDPDQRIYHPTVTHTSGGMKLEGGE
jgi:hypothetical protein